MYNETAALMRRIAELEKDAARYRYLRQHVGMMSLDDDVFDAIEERANGDELDAAIDAALISTASNGR